jgi:hypothetical protein
MDGQIFFCLVFGFLVSFFLGGELEKQRKAQIFWVGRVFVCLLFIGFFVGGRAFKKERKKENSNLSKSEGHITP